jgi:hypothetical protein
LTAREIIALFWFFRKTNGIADCRLPIGNGSIANCRLPMSRLPIADCQLPIGVYRSTTRQVAIRFGQSAFANGDLEIGNWQSPIGNLPMTIRFAVARPAGLEPALRWTQGASILRASLPTKPS